MRIMLNLVGGLALLGSTASNAAVIQSTLELVSGTSISRGTNSEVDYWYFTANSSGTVTIDTLSWQWDKDGDGIAHHMDPFIYLFRDDGSLDSGDYVGDNDDSASTLTDGSTSPLDSYLSVTLSAGNYVLAISDFSLSFTDALSGVNTNGYYPAVFDGTGNYLEYDGSCATQGYDCSYADYQITFGGDITVRNVGVPEPGTLAVLGIGIAALGVRRR